MAIYRLCYTVQLAELPESFSQLSKLKTLDLFDNRLVEIPDCLEMLKMLTRLDLGEVCFSGLASSAVVDNCSATLTGQDPVLVQIQSRKWNWLGRTLR